jgi:ubiquinone/menaquinone biosynthesis C-methylase UbiE
MNDTPALFADGKAYEQFMGRWSRLAGRDFLGWLAQPKGLHWLDVGCGNGAFTEVLIAQAQPAAVDAVDPSEGQLAYARTRPGASLAKFRQADAQALPFADKSFDAAIMALVISFVPDPLKAVREMARVVHPGGMVATYMWDIPGGGLPNRPLHGAMQALGLPSPFPPGAEASRQDRMQALWQQAGLQSVETRVIRIPVTFSSFDDFWDSHSAPVGPAGTAIAKLSAEKKQQLKDTLRQRLPQGADGRVSYEAFANAVKGRVAG